MSFEPIDLAVFTAHLDRPGATPAPTNGGHPKPTPDNPIPSRPGPQHVPFKACGCGVLAGEQCDCAEITAQHEKQLDKAIWFGRRAA